MSHRPKLLSDANCLAPSSGQWRWTISVGCVGTESTPSCPPSPACWNRTKDLRDMRMLRRTSLYPQSALSHNLYHNHHFSPNHHHRPKRHHSLIRQLRPMRFHNPSRHQHWKFPSNTSRKLSHRWLLLRKHPLISQSIQRMSWNLSHCPNLNNFLILNWSKRRRQLRPEAFLHGRWVAFIGRNHGRRVTALCCKMAFRAYVSMSLSNDFILALKKNLY